MKSCIRYVFSSLLLCAALVSFTGNAFAYCVSRGTTSSYEWIQSTNIAGVSRVSGNNGGYASFTSPVINLNAGANSIALTAGGSYSEYWKVWIDFNRDDSFADNEAVFSGSSTGTLSGGITVPSTALSGETGMRISMKYGSAPTPCGNFSYGEVEDYRVSLNTVDITPPSVVTRSPSSGWTGVAVNTTITITFSENLNPASVNNSSVSLSTGGVNAAGTVALNGKTITFTPSQRLDYAALYQVTAHAGVADLAGNAMSQNVSWSFTTVAPDLTPPVVTQTWPASGETDVPNSSLVQARFSEPLDPQSVNSSTVRVSKDGVDIAGTVLLNGGDQNIFFDPDQSFDYLATYTVTISGVRDLAGNTLQSAYSWSFTAREYLVPYCESRSNNYQFIWISSVKVGNFTHHSSAMPYTGYSDHTSLVFQLGRSWQLLELTSTDTDTWTNYPAHWRVFIDWNQNGSYDDNEIAFSGNGPAKVSGNIAVPEYALSGNTRMRVSMQYGGYPPACGTFATGEVEDFRVYIPAPLSDPVPPSVVSTTPAAGADNGKADAPVTALFSEAINWKTLDATSFTLSGLNGPVAASVHYDYQNRRAVLTPNQPLEHMSSYTATLSGIEDIKGNVMTEAYSWSFTTRPDPGPAYAVSGKVLHGGAALAGVTISLAGADPATTVTDSSGQYSFTKVYAGAHLLTPSKPGFEFSPESAAIDVVDSNLFAVDFNAQIPPGTLINGDFEMGDFTGFTSFLTSSGMMTKSVVMFDTDNDGMASLAAKFIVGNNNPSSLGVNGGGIYQMLNLGNGDLSVTIDTASAATAYNNSGGTVQVFFDGVLMASHNFGSINANTKEVKVLSFTKTGVTAGQHELRIQLTRGYTPTTAVSNYVDDIVITGTSTQN